MRYTQNQQKAIDHREGNPQIIAYTGSGKTEVITRRITKLVSTGVPKESIVAFTFTKNAAEELKIFFMVRHIFFFSLSFSPNEVVKYNTNNFFCAITMFVLFQKI